MDIGKEVIIKKNAQTFCAMNNNSYLCVGK